MAELFMECDEEELEPWQQKLKPIVVDDDDDDDEPIFVGEILSSKPTSTYILNRVNPNSSRIGMQNGASKRGFHSMTRPATSTLAVQPQPRVSSTSATSPALQRPLSGCSTPQEAAKSSAGLAQPISRPPTAPSLSRNLSLPGLAQSASRPVATVTAQPVTLSRAPNNNSGITFGLRPNSGGPQCQSVSTVNTGLTKRPSTSEADSIAPKKSKANEMGSSRNDSPGSPSGVTSKNGAPFPQACPKCNIHFNLLEPLKNHIKYCCPDMVHTFLGVTKTDCSGTAANTAETESGKLIMLVNDFYYGKHEGNVQQVRQEEKTYTTFKCASCMKLLKSNIRFMNHMKHHLEVEKQNSESWESHTTCQHCYRQFPTPFQLQCHIESTHTPHESSTICKICELSFETEQILLQHMKDNHKPGEMPYVCQVCNYRSSVFLDVEKHFRAVHENTKNLLCPFCLKVIKIGAPYMHHFMRHQKKGVHRCTKCRLQFLTCKEKMDHKSQHHRTFKKPVQLEGLPPGTKVTIRASAGSLQPVSTTTSSVSTSPSTLQLSPGVKMANTKSQNKLSTSKTRSKLKPLSIQKKQSLGNSSGSVSSTSSLSSSIGAHNNKNNKISNTALNNLRCPDIQKCIECYSDIRTFASHFPAYVHCSLCRYSTSCSKAYVNHMMSFHSTRQTKRFWIYKAHSDELSGMTVVCLNCDFLTDVSGLDKMATHLNDNETHTCQVIIENVSKDFLAADNLVGLSNEVLLNNESDEKIQELSRPNSPEEEKETSLSESLQIKDIPEEVDKDHLGNPSDEAALVAKCKEGNKTPVLVNSVGPELQTCSGEPLDPREVEKAGSLRNQSEEGSLAIEDETMESLVPENVSALGLKDSAEEESESPRESQTDEKNVAAKGESVPAPNVEDGSSLEPHTGSQYSARDGNTEDFASPGDEDPVAAGHEESTAPSVLENHTRSESSASSKDHIDAAESRDLECLSNQKDGFLATKCEEYTLPSVLENESNVGPSACSQNSIDAAEGEDANCLLSEGDDSLVAECQGRTSLSFLEKSPSLGPSACTDDNMDAAEEGADSPSKREGGSLTPACEESPLPAVLEVSAYIGPSACSEKPIGAAEEDKNCLSKREGGCTAPACEESPLLTVLKAPASIGPFACSEDPIDTAEDEDCLSEREAGCILPACEESLLPAVLKPPVSIGPSACSEDPIDTTEDEDCLTKREGGSLAPACEEAPLPTLLEAPASIGPSSCSEDPMDVAEKEINCLSTREGGSLTPACEESTLLSALEAPASIGPSACSENPIGTAEEDTDWPSKSDGGCMAPACEKSPLPPILEAPANIGPSVCSDDLISARGGGDPTDCLLDERDCSPAAKCEESPLTPVLETETSAMPTSSSNESINPSKETSRDRLGMESDEALSAAQHKDDELVSHEEESRALEGLIGPRGGFLKDAANTLPGNLSGAGEEKFSDASLAKNASSPVHQVCPEESCERAASEDPKGGEERPHLGNGPNGSSHHPPDAADAAVQVQAVDPDEAELTDVNLDNVELGSDENVSFEQFLRRRGEPDSAASDVSDQGSVHLEPLTPSEVLEHEATEILQKGGVASSTKTPLTSSEQGDSASSDVGSPGPEEALLGQSEGSEEAS